jgi:coenzyme PQQ precursor peptide PqqA
VNAGSAAASRFEFGNDIEGNATMAWTTPTLVEICIGLEINGYLPAEL